MSSLVNLWVRKVNVEDGGHVLVFKFYEVSEQFLLNLKWILFVFRKKLFVERQDCYSAGHYKNDLTGSGEK